MEGERDVEMCIKPLHPSNGRTLREMQYPSSPLPSSSLLSQFTPASVFEYYNRFSRFPLQLKQKYDWTVKLDGKVCLSSILNCHVDISHFRFGPLPGPDITEIVITQNWNLI